MEVSTATEYPKCITEALALIDDQRKTVLSMVDDVRFAESLIEKFKGLQGTSNWHIDLGCFFDDVDVHVTAEDFREIVHVRRWLRKQGFPAPTMVEYGSLGQTLWRYSRKGHQSFDLTVHTSYDENAVCKYVKVGTKEEPVYELQCDGKAVAINNSEDK